MSKILMHKQFDNDEMTMLKFDVQTYFIVENFVNFAFILYAIYIYVYYCICIYLYCIFCLFCLLCLFLHATPDSLGVDN